jgi:hypothetical protein
MMIDMQTKWNLAFALWLVAGLAILAGYLAWYAMQPKITRIEWGNGQIDYWDGRVDPTTLSGLHQAQSGVKSRTVMVKPSL